jgi:hypothetical protein
MLEILSCDAPKHKVALYKAVHFEVLVNLANLVKLGQIWWSLSQAGGASSDFKFTTSATFSIFYLGYTESLSLSFSPPPGWQDLLKIENVALVVNLKSELAPPAWLRLHQICPSFTKFARFTNTSKCTALYSATLCFGASQLSISSIEIMCYVVTLQCGNVHAYWVQRIALSL